MNGNAIIQIEALIVRLIGVLLGVCLISMVAVNVVNVVGRYSGGFALVGADELLVYSMIWIVMLGAILAARNRDHLSVNLLPVLLTGRLAATLQIVIDTATVTVSGFIAWQSFSFIERIASLNQTSMGLGLPMVLPHTAIFVGFAGIAAVTAFLMVIDIIRLTKPAGNQP